MPVYCVCGRCKGDFIPASKLALNYVEDTEEYLNKPIQVQVLDVDKEVRN